MEVVKKTIKYDSRSEKFNILPIGDIHLGNKGCCKEKLKQTVDFVKNTPNTYWIGMGDYCECITPSDPRFDPYSIDKHYQIKDLSHLIRRQIDDLLHIFEPMEDKCLGILCGNHEEKIRTRGYYDIGLTLAREMKVKYLGYNGWIRINFRRQTNNKHPSTVYKIYCSHGNGSSRKNGAKINRIEDVLSFMDADIAILAHEHKKIIAPPVVKIGLDTRGNVTERKQFGFMSGSFLKTYIEGGVNYGEKKLYAPADLGTVRIILKPDVKDIHASL